MRAAHDVAPGHPDVLRLQHLVQFLRRGGFGFGRGARSLAKIERRRRRLHPGLQTGHRRDPGGDFVIPELRPVRLVILVILFVLALALGQFLELSPALGLVHGGVVRRHVVVLLGPVHAEDVAVDRVTVLVHRGFTPAAGVVPERGARGNGRGEPGDLEVGVRRRRSVALHVDEPRGWSVVGHPERLLDLLGQHPGFLTSQVHLELLPFKVQFARLGHFGFGLKLEKRVVKHLVVDVDLPELRGGSILSFLFQPLRVLLLRVRVAKFLDARRLDEPRELPRRLFDAPLTLQKLSFLRPVPGHRDRVAVRLEVHQKPRIRRGGVPHLHHLRLGAVLLELRDLHAGREFLLFPADFILVVG